MKKFNIKYFIPVAIVILFLIFFSQVLNRDVSKLSSQLIEKPIPTFYMPTLFNDDQSFNTSDVAEKNVALVNIWASWFIPCRSEH